MRVSVPSLLLVIPIVAFVGCTKPDVDFVKIRIGMTRNQVIGLLGNPSKTSVMNHLEIFEYEAYDRYGALKVNRRWQYVRFINGKVESFGNKGDVDTAKTPTSQIEVEQKVSVDRPEEAVDGMPGASTPAPFDLRTELEKLEKMKKDGLITEAEFKELRQRTIEKAKAQ